MPQFQPILDYPAGLDQFTKDYMEALEWTNVNKDHIPELKGNEKFSEAIITSVKGDCYSFQELNADDLTAYKQATGYSGGVDFWLTRNGHGAGFWDRGLGELGDRLSEAAELCGSLDVYRGDDGLIYTQE